jgi:hypothetical protein
VEDEEEAVVEANGGEGDGDADTEAGMDEEEREFKLGETVWVWDEVPAPDDKKEGDQSWNLFKAKIDKIELGREGGDEYSLEIWKEFLGYSFDRLHMTRDEASTPLNLDKNLAEARQLFV